MPQLNPSPWFSTMLLSWLTLTLVMQPKLLSFTPTPVPQSKAMHTKTTPWAWPWT
uniref:ATP synthase complex subunit 8 n=1 Tax=Phoeniculus purpureus TaxID=113189 RepID=A0A3G2LKN3_PHOPU|nr:ATP synthase F0 subunit 8 [Phoeniculus purpureus]